MAPFLDYQWQHGSVCQLEQHDTTSEDEEAIVRAERAACCPWMSLRRIVARGATGTNQAHIAGTNLSESNRCC